MSNTLTFTSVHKSITRLDDITLPKFVVLTGRNGSGKTHLLTAIKGGQVRSSLAPDVNVDVRLFDSATIIPADTGIFDPAQDQSKRSQWFTALTSNREQHYPGLRQHAINLGVPAEYCLNIKKINSLTVEELRAVLQDASKAEEVAASIKQHIKQLGSNVGSNSFNQIGDEYWRKAVPKIQQNSPEDFLVSSQSAFFQNRNFLWGDVDPFQQAFGRVFTRYRELIHDNDRLQKYPPPDDPSRRYLSPEEFVAEYGTPPWDFVNQILEECRLDFRVDNPPLHEIASYEPKLYKLSTTVEMRFLDLSSGEKVLMSFALCIYNSQDSRQAIAFPKLLLLDEVDAPLHPSMAASLLNTIQNVLVRDRNVSVILTTHNPSTVALAPEEAIYSMNPAGPRIDKVSKSFALSLLTTGVPTLSISFDGRRQIFVESRTDANLYDMLYQRYKGLLNSERSLVFVEVGNTDASGGEKNAGCAQVMRLVDSLTAGGNQSVLGLVDWDGDRVPKDRMHVLSPGVRDGLESLLFDPVLLVVTIAGENSSFAKTKGILDPEDSYISISNWDVARWQRAIDILQNIVLGDSLIQRDTVEIKYINGMTLQISKEYLHLDDHALEQKIISLFGFLIPKNKRAGDLMRHVVDTVLADYHALLPVDLLDTLNGLLTVELVI
jgi:ABC-type molybdenum transport system ATPase subunit/photorepair protein PhrA